MRRVVTFVLVALLATTVVVLAQERPSQPGSGGVTAQAGGGGGGQNGPIITLIQPAPMPANFYAATPTIEIDWCDNVTVLVGSTRWIKLDGVLKTSSFTYQSASGGNCSGSHYTSTSNTVTIPLGVHTLSAYICNDELQCTQAAWLIERLAGPMPTVSITPYSADLQDYGRCALACFAATHAQSTVPYFSLDAPRSVTLVYNGDRVDPRPFIHVNVRHGGDGSNLPSYFTLKVQRAGPTWVTFLNGETEMRFGAAAVDSQRIGGQFRAADNGMTTTGVYAVNVVVGAVYATGTVEVTTPTRVIVLNEENSPIARGWTVAGIQRLYPNQLGSGALITEGDGSALYFAWSGSVFLTPTGEFSRLSTIQGGGWRRSYPDSTVVTFNAQGYMTSVRDRWGNRDSVQYDGSNRPWLLRDPLLAYHAFYYDANGLDRINTSVGLTTEVTVQTNRTLTAVTDPDGVATSFGYDGSLRLSTVTDRRGVQVAEIGYAGSSGKVISVTGPLVPVYQGGSVRPVTAFAPWQLLGVPTSTTIGTPFPVVRADSARARVTDPGGHLSRYTVNRFGQPVRTIDQAGDSATVLYTLAGQVDSVINPLGVNAGYDYDANGNATRAQVGGITSRARYHSTWATQPDSIWGDAMPVRQLGIGANGRTNWVRTAGQYFTTNLVYDTRGRVQAATDPGQHLTAFARFDGPLGNRNMDSLPGGRTRAYVYDGIGRAVRVAYATGRSDSIEYDAVGRVQRRFDGVNPLPTIYAWDDGLLTSVTDPQGQVYHFTYDALGRLTSRTDPAGAADSVQYDIDGLPRRIVNRRRQEWVLGYDGLHRQRSRHGAVVDDTVAISADGRTITTANGAAAITTWLNATWKVPDSVRTELIVPGGGTRSFVHRYLYRSNGLLDSTEATGPSGLSLYGRRYGYNSLRFTLDSLRLGGQLTVIARNDDGQQTAIRFPGGDSISSQYVPGHDPAQLRSRVLFDTHHYDDEGRLDQQRTPAGLREFGYDDLGRLRVTEYATIVDSVCFGAGDDGVECYTPYDSLYSYSYDSAGNRIGIEMRLWNEQTPTWSVTGVYEAGNRIQAFAGCSYDTDADGNVTQRACPGQTLTFGWSADGRLTSIAVAGGNTISFAYDPAGRLVRRDVNGSPASYFLWEGDNLHAELGADGATRVGEYSYYGLDDLHAFIWGQTPASPQYAHRDAVGNIRGLGGVSRSYEYDSWGALVGGTDWLGFGGVDRARWKGALYLAPEADLYYMRNRWYEPRTGRFLSEDPLGLAGGLNLYSFAGDDPVQGSDPLGLAECPQGKTIGSNFKDCVPLIGGIEITSGGGPVAPLPSSEQEWWEHCVRMSTCFDLGTYRNSPPDWDPVIPPSQVRRFVAERAVSAAAAGARCIGSGVAFTANTVTSAAVIAGGFLVGYGVVSATTSAVAWGISGAEVGGTITASAMALESGARLLYWGAAPSSVTYLGWGGDVVAGTFSARSLAPVVGWGDAVNAVTANCFQY